MPATDTGTIKSLDRHLSAWIRTTGRRWRTREPETVRLLTAMWGEIANRTRQYPLLGRALRSDRLDRQQIARIARDCYALKGQFDAIRLARFFDEDRATSAIASLVRDFPVRAREAGQRIDRFVDRAITLGFRNAKGGNDAAGAALFASVLLTALEPNRFVDFRRSRWTEMAQTLRYSLREQESYGQAIVEAGQFAQTVCRTPTFRRHWPDQQPLWVLSGICWMRSNPPKPKVEPPELAVEIEDDAEFPEGRLLQRLHQVHERNRKVVALAKQLALQRNPQLPCDVCDFSFRAAFGDIGMHFIEAHHTKPVASLKRGHRTKVEDIALVCSNCHSMLHGGDRTLRTDELREIVESRRSRKL